MSKLRSLGEVRQRSFTISNISFRRAIELASENTSVGDLKQTLVVETRKTRISLELQTLIFSRRRLFRKWNCLLLQRAYSKIQVF